MWWNSQDLVAFDKKTPWDTFKIYLILGDYLGEKNDFNEDVLKAFVALHDFTNLILVQALR